MLGCYGREIETLDVEPFLQKPKSVEGRAGRDVVSARMLLTLWTYAISVGVGSGREMDWSASNWWLERMDTEEAKQTMRARASLCELTNGHAKTRFAMASLLVCGLDKVTCIALLTALTMYLVALLV